MSQNGPARSNFSTCSQAGGGTSRSISSPLGVGVEEGADDVEELRLVGPGGDGDHLAVEVGGDVGGGDQGLELLEPLLAVEELAAVGEVPPEPLVDQAELLEQDRGPVRPEAAAVEADVEQPVVLVVGLFGRASRAGTCRWGRHAPGGS